ncbi:hypothetical protein BZK31_19105 [Pseudomonas floridensis]|uniref:Uncharacterized protein n=1 Tax=Pseudomonas floridensis TaxID=1958950 RepID=A0A1X0N2V7_9PSED|nr:hypothetical protein [Pseudomonas floridensis]ORC57643.1 hypothetical protein BZK31_19105 [Pseudomonas floridensis]
MPDVNYKGCFTARLELHDNTPLGFHTIVDGQRKEDDCLQVQSESGQTIEFFFRPYEKDAYVLAFTVSMPKEWTEIPIGDDWTGIPLPTDWTEIPIPDGVKSQSSDWAYLGFGEEYSIGKTKIPEFAYPVALQGDGGSEFSIDSDAVQSVYLKCLRPGYGNMQIAKSKTPPGDVLFSRPREDSEDALFKLTILSRYDADGSSIEK